MTNCLRLFIQLTERRKEIINVRRKKTPSIKKRKMNFMLSSKWAQYRMHTLRWRYDYWWGKSCKQTNEREWMELSCCLSGNWWLSIWLIWVMRSDWGLKMSDRLKECAPVESDSGMQTFKCLKILQLNIT